MTLENPPDVELRKEVFAWYGGVAYCVQCFETELAMLLTITHRLTEPESTPKDRDELLKELLHKKTLGALITELKKHITPHSNFAELLATYLKKRNYVAHRFFYENGDKLLTAAGCQGMLEELKSLHAMFEEANEIGRLMSANMRRVCGIDEEALQKLVDQEMASASQEPTT